MDTPEDAGLRIAEHEREPAAPLRQACNLCGGDAFGPGPGGRLAANGSAPHCERCGSLERHRVASRALQGLPKDFLDWRRALLVKPEREDDPTPFRRCDLALADGSGDLLRDLAAREDGLYDFIGLVHVLEYLDNDRFGFEQLIRLLSPRGLLQVCFVDPQARPWTSIATGPAGTARRRYGRDVSTHFRCLGLRVHMTVAEVADPGTGVVLPVHFFYRNPRHQAALESLAATRPEAGSGPTILDAEQVETRKQYILQRAKGLDAALLPLGDPAGKDVLVFGCGLGNEMLWCARHRARSALGIDLGSVKHEPLAALMAEEGHADFDYAMHECNVHDLALDHPGRYDLIVSNGVFEHVTDLKGVLNALRPLLRPGGRIAIYAEGLWFSSTGGHLGRFNWEHLWMAPRAIKERFPERWNAFRSNLNRMTAADFLQAVRDVGAVVLQFSVRSDPHLPKLAPLMPQIVARQQVSPTDMSITSISCELCFLEHL
ncbi:MAG: methyltransferase domain-containing protein [Burkholderiaceae bacterium]